MSVSVIILTKDRAGLFQRALRSVFVQTAPPSEIIVVDDGSTDETGEVLRAYGDQLRVVTHERSKGIIASRQEALKLATGDFIALLDDDDEWISPHKLTLQLSEFTRVPRLVLMGTAAELMAPDGARTIRSRPIRDAILRRSMLFRNNFFTSSVMFRRKEALEVGGFLPSDRDLAEDYDLWLRLGVRGHLANLAEPLVRYRRSYYSSDKFQSFLSRQIELVARHRHDYPHAGFASHLLGARLWYSQYTKRS